MTTGISLKELDSCRLYIYIYIYMSDQFQSTSERKFSNNMQKKKKKDPRKFVLLP